MNMTDSGGGTLRPWIQLWGGRYLDVLSINVSIGVQQQADDSGVASQHSPVQRCVLVIFVTQVDRHIEGQ